MDFLANPSRSMTKNVLCEEIIANSSSPVVTIIAADPKPFSPSIRDGVSVNSSNESQIRVSDRVFDPKGSRIDNDNGSISERGPRSISQSRARFKSRAP